MYSNAEMIKCVRSDGVVIEEYVDALQPIVVTQCVAVLHAKAIDLPLGSQIGKDVRKILNLGVSALSDRSRGRNGNEVIAVYGCCSTRYAEGMRV